MADIVGSFQRGQQFGTQQRQQRETEQRRGRLSELAQLAYGAQPMQRQELVRQAIGVDPGAGFELDQSLQKAGEAKMQELVNSARLFINAPETSRPGLMQALKPRLEELGLDVPDYTPDSAAQFLENAKAFVATHGGGGQANLGDRYRVIGGSLVDLQDPTRAVYQAPQRYLTEQGLIEVGPEGAREVTLGGGPAQVGGIGEVQPGTGFSIGADIPPEVAAQIAAQEREAGGVQIGAMPGQRILPRGAGVEQERLQLARQAAARSEEAARIAREADAQRRQFGSIPAGFRVNAAGTALEPVPGGPKPAGAVATEGERKAATLLKRLEGSLSQLGAAVSEDPSAASPSVVAEFGRSLPFVGETAANILAGPERQRVEAAQLDILDAALTLGTGAAYTKEQLEGYRRSYFPRIGDSQSTIADKQRRLQNVISAARIAAGRASGGSSATESSDGGVSRPTTEAEYNQLPRGALFVDPDDGRTYRKP